MTPDEKKRVQAIEDRANAATPGKWVFKADEPGYYCPEVYQDLGADVGLHVCDFGIDVSRHDVRFMTAARADIPWLIALVRETDAHLHGKGGE